MQAPTPPLQPPPGFSGPVVPANQATKFVTPELLLPALLHTAKGVLMSDLRCCTVAAEGVQRGRVFA